MKPKIIPICSVLFAVLVSVFSFNANSQTVITYNDIRYIIEDSTAIIGRQNKELSGNIVIPDSIIYNGKSFIVSGIVAPTDLTAWSSNVVTTEGGAFQNCEISSISLPSTITTVSAGAFNSCSKLSNVQLSSQTKILGAACFANCTSLAYVKIPESVSEFGSLSNYGFLSYTFGNCTKLSQINIPNGVTCIEAGCFKDCALDSIFIHSGINHIGEDAFAVSNLRVVKSEIKDITKISYSLNVFKDVTSAELLVPKGSVSLYQAYEPWRNFRKVIEYGDNGEELTPDIVYLNIDGLEYIIKDGKAIVSRQSTSLCGDIVIPEQIVYKNKYYNVSEIIAPTDLTVYSSSEIICEGGAFQNSQISSIIIPKTISSIAAGAFQNCYSLQKVSLPNSIKVLEAACFANCSSLSEINLPNSITDLGSETAYGYCSYVFGGCRKLKSITLPQKVNRLASGCFLNSAIESIEIPANCTYLGQRSLSSSALKEITLYSRELYNLNYPETTFGDVSSVVVRVPYGCKSVYQEFYPWINCKTIEEFDDGSEIAKPNLVIANVDGLRYILNGKEAIVGRQNKELTGDIIIPGQINFNNEIFNVTSIGNPSNVTAWSSNRVSVEGGAFQDCNITSIVIPNSITDIPAGAFYNCKDLLCIDLNDSVTCIGAACFANCSALTEIKIPDAVTSFGSYTTYGFKSYVFGNCKSLKKINIPLNVTKFCQGCFKDSGLETFLIPQNVTALEEECFANCPFNAVKICHQELASLKYTESIFANVSEVTLYVPEGKKDLYSQFYPWKNFKEIIEYRDQDDEFQYNAYNVRYVIPAEKKTRSYESIVYSQQYIPSGIPFNEIELPSMDGFIFKGWRETPNIMPSEDIIIEAIYERFTGVKDIVVDNIKKDIYYDLQGRIVTPIHTGIYIHNGKKVLIER